MAGQDASHLPVKPQSKPSVSRYMDAFYDLCTTRQAAYGVAVISWLAIEQYALAKRYDAFDKYFLHRVVRALDPIYVRTKNDELKTSKASNKS